MLDPGTRSGAQRPTAHDSRAELGPAPAPKSARPWTNETLPLCLQSNVVVAQLVKFNPWVRNIPLEKGMVIHSDFLARRIPWTEEPGGLQSVGSRRIGHD